MICIRLCWSIIVAVMERPQLLHFGCSSHNLSPQYVAIEGNYIMVNKWKQASPVEYVNYVQKTRHAE